MASKKIAGYGLGAASGLGVTYFALNSYYGDPKERARQSFSAEKVCIKINFCSA